jgi:ABC-type uncharacterized transport system substrate-binding protein
MATKALNFKMEETEIVAELLAGEHPENVDVKRIKGKRNDYFRSCRFKG